MRYLHLYNSSFEVKIINVQRLFRILWSIEMRKRMFFLFLAFSITITLIWRQICCRNLSQKSRLDIYKSSEGWQIDDFNDRMFEIRMVRKEKLNGNKWSSSMKIVPWYSWNLIWWRKIEFGLVSILVHYS